MIGRASLQPEFAIFQHLHDSRPQFRVAQRLRQRNRTQPRARGRVDQRREMAE